MVGQPGAVSKTAYGCYVQVMSKDNSPRQSSGRSEREIEGNWPNTVRTRDELDSALEAGLASGVSPYSAQQIIERAIKRFKDGKL